MATFSIGESIRFGWETFKMRPWFLVGLALLTFAVSLVSSLVSEPVERSGVVSLIVLVSLASAALGIAVQLAVYKIAIRAHDSIETAEYADALPLKPFWKFVGATVLQGVLPMLAALAAALPLIPIGYMLENAVPRPLIVAVGVAVIVIAAAYVALRIIFMPILVADRSLGPISALKESMRITRGVLGKILLFFVVAGLLNVAGALLLFVGLLVTVPLTLIATVHVYRTLEHTASELAPVSEAPAAAPAA
ncbi:hypothetical protein COU20_01030 [Candidatus Kaiserbacteria bacterium CG10_big_fil_rev_8_21_14_0_10_59_10]|uniref:Glycerophosphoryl diester phosphodiesterase membrane domain-containing protein n=1 Tax=Candidatus Kaiserbacteria bacterium CG10_big_fil_rev_8_21_14_0_10_59_10 TaxID=1974612 RepID=A0A2H0U8D8_9BACT|nr:MAG: hypothetical protein COU20_01030 [Candidatus Kaiserbacteria bacterium CG10_big_fil_rev_8_21_14_0_10_59_10]